MQETDTDVIEFVVWGKPATAGSKRAFPFQKANGGLGVRVSDANPRTKTWQADVKSAAMEAYRGPVLTGPLELRLLFVHSRPKGHFRTGRNAHLLREDAPGWPQTRPDALKLARSVEDALTGILWADDAQIVHEQLTKIYGDRPCCVVTVRPMPEEDNP